MKVKNILITGDDGYNSIGTRLLIYFLQDKYALTVCATKAQQSGVGGKMNLNSTITWHETKVDGIRAVWVDSTPTDAVEFASSYFNQQFDLAISGINLGPNVSTLISSGTFAAATRVLTNKLSPHVMSVGWDLPRNLWFKDHNGKDEIQIYLKYPGEIMYKIFKLAIKNDFWNSELLNINFPEKTSNQVIFTKPLDDKKTFYSNPLIDKKTNTFTYMSKPKKVLNPIETDAGALQHGFISITPCKADMLKEEVYEKFKNTKLNL